MMQKILDCIGLPMTASIVAMTGLDLTSTESSMLHESATKKFLPLQVQFTLSAHAQASARVHKQHKVKCWNTSIPDP